MVINHSGQVTKIGDQNLRLQTPKLRAPKLGRVRAAQSARLRNSERPNSGGLG